MNLSLGSPWRILWHGVRAYYVGWTMVGRCSARKVGGISRADKKGNLETNATQGRGFVDIVIVLYYSRATLSHGSTSTQRRSRSETRSLVFYTHLASTRSISQTPLYY